jgi:hypothetical protein
MRSDGLAMLLLIYVVQVGLYMLFGVPGIYAAAFALGGCLVYAAASSS